MTATPRNICASAAARGCADSEATGAGKERKRHNGKHEKIRVVALLEVDDVSDGPLQETTIEVTDGKWDKPVLKFESGAQFSLNKVNTGDMIAAYGDESDGWVGVTIELFAGEVKYGGDTTDSVRIRPVTPRTPKSSGQADDDEIPFKAAAVLIQPSPQNPSCCAGKSRLATRRGGSGGCLIRRFPLAASGKN